MATATARLTSSTSVPTSAPTSAHAHATPRAARPTRRQRAHALWAELIAALAQAREVARQIDREIPSRADTLEPGDKVVGPYTYADFGKDAHFVRQLLNVGLAHMLSEAPCSVVNAAEDKLGPDYCGSVWAEA